MSKKRSLRTRTVPHTKHSNDRVAASSKAARNQRLVALPVPGDAFLLVRGELNVLVDGGMNGETLHELLRNELGGVPAIHRILCTHNDSDHAEGLAAMLGHSSNSLALGEVWLPGSWADPLFLIAADSRDFVERIVGSVVQAACDSSNDANRPNLKRALTALMKGEDITGVEPEPGARTVGEHQNKQSSQSRLYQLNMVLDPARDYWGHLRARTWYQKADDVASIVRKMWNKPRSQPGMDAAIALSYYLIKAGERIIKIADGASTRGAQLRWFDARSYYEEQPTRRALGGDAHLYPLNAKELLVPPDLDADLADVLFLTVVNRHSLVFYAPETEYGPSTIFSADGLLDCDAPLKPPRKTIAVTAPHHGSATNAAAYANLSTMLGKAWQEAVILVRSDRYVKTNPCDEYKSAHKRLCTVCPSRGKLHRKVTLTVDPKLGEWDFPNANKTHVCDCP